MDIFNKIKVEQATLILLKISIAIFFKYAYS